MLEKSTSTEVQLMTYLGKKLKDTYRVKAGKDSLTSYIISLIKLKLNDVLVDGFITDLNSATKFPTERGMLFAFDEDQSSLFMEYRNFMLDGFAFADPVDDCRKAILENISKYKNRYVVFVRKG